MTLLLKEGVPFEQDKENVDSNRHQPIPLIHD